MDEVELTQNKHVYWEVWEGMRRRRCGGGVSSATFIIHYVYNMRNVRIRAISSGRDLLVLRPRGKRAREPGQAEQGGEGTQTGLQQRKLYTGTKPVESQMVILKRL